MPSYILLASSETYPLSAHSGAIDVTLLALQAGVVAFLLLHDWVPLGRLNNLSALRSTDTLQHRAWVTLLGAVPAGFCLFSSAQYLHRPYPRWLELWLWMTYASLLLGLLWAWWVPYLFVPDAERAARYRVIFAGTHSFLPRRNGLAPDTLHTVFHVAVVATMILLFIRGRVVPLAASGSQEPAAHVAAGAVKLNRLYLYTLRGDA